MKKRKKRKVLWRLRKILRKQYKIMLCIIVLCFVISFVSAAYQRNKAIVWDGAVSLITGYNIKIQSPGKPFLKIKLRKNVFYTDFSFWPWEPILLMQATGTASKEKIVSQKYFWPEEIKKRNRKISAKESE